MVTEKRPSIAPLEFEPDTEETTDSPAQQPLPPMELAHLPDEPEVNEDVRPVAEPLRPRRSWMGWIAGSIGLLLLLALSFEAYDFVRSAFARHEIFGLAVVLLVAVALVGLTALIWREIRAFRQLVQCESIRRTATMLLSSESHGESQQVIPPLDTLYRGRVGLSRELSLFHQADHHDLSDAERIRRFESTVLRRVDQQVREEILYASRDISLMTAIVPLGSIDSFYVLYRSLRMMRQVAQLYGVRPSWFASFRILRRILAQSAVAGASEIITDTATHALGASIIGVVSARMAQGLTNGILSARIGLTVMDQVRPLPFHENTRPSLSDLRNELVRHLPSKL